MLIVNSQQIIDNNTWRESFFSLAQNTFSLQFQQWYEWGLWDPGQYDVYAVVDQDEVVAAVAISLHSLVIDNQVVPAGLIGTVMTDIRYQGKGLSKKLMLGLLAHYESKLDIIYLSANASVLEFYPKFGFEKREMASYNFIVKDVPKRTLEWEKISLYNEDQRQRIIHKINERVAVSRIFGVIHHTGIVLHNLLYKYEGHVYYNKELDAYVVYSIKENTLELYDVITSEDIALEMIVQSLPLIGVQNIYFGFTVEQQSLDIHKSLFIDDGALFVKNIRTEYPNNVLIPYTSLA